MRPVNVYVTMVSERHSGTYPYLFWTAAEAITYARDTAHGYATTPEHVQEQPPNDERLYHVRWSPEADYAWVMERHIDGAPPSTLILHTDLDRCSLAELGGCAGPVDTMCTAHTTLLHMRWP